MATVNQILHRKNSSGTYDTIHLETDASVVMRADGIHNVEESLSVIENSKLIKYDADGTVPPYIVGIDADTLEGHPASYFAVASQDPIPAPSSHTPGDVITWDNKEWLVCHYDSSKNQVYLIAKDVVDKCFGFSSISQTPAIQYEKYNMSKGALVQCVPVTNHSITSQVFIPTYDQMNGGFSWFNSDDRRIAYYQGSAISYFTSSAYNIMSVWRVRSVGSFDGYDRLSEPLGFRPCVCVQL